MTESGFRPMQNFDGASLTEDDAESHGVAAIKPRGTSSRFGTGSKPGATIHPHAPPQLSEIQPPRLSPPRGRRRFPLQRFHHRPPARRGARNTFAVQCPGCELEVIPAPGSFELPALALAAANAGRFDGIVALGCLIKGETIHDRVIADAVAHGLVQVNIATGVPVTFGVLTVDTPEQAQARAGGDEGNKGADAMTALLETIAAIAALNGKRGSDSTPTAKPDKAAKLARTSVRRSRQ